MNATTMRGVLERLGRNRRFRRRLPAGFGRRALWVSPDARLRYLRWGDQAFDQELLAFARDWIVPGTKILDVGANVGEFAVSAAHRAGPQGRVLAVEADPFLVSLVQHSADVPRNADLNIDVMCAAVAEGAGIQRFNIAARGRAANALAEVGSTQMGGVRRALFAPTVDIDSIAEVWGAPDFIKIDVEGAEIRVLKGATRTLEQQRPTVIFEANLDKSALMNVFRQAGYSVFDPADRALKKPLEECIFNNLAIHESRLDEMRRIAATR